VVNHLRVLKSSLDERSWLVAVKGSFPFALGTFTIVIVTLLGNVYWNTSPVVLISLFYVLMRLAQAATEGMSLLGQAHFARPFFNELYRETCNVYVLKETINGDSTVAP